MTKIVGSLIILGLFANVCFAYSGVAPVSSSQSSAFSSSNLNSSATKVWNVGNTTDAPYFDSSATTNNGAGIYASQVFFGPALTNGTSYAYGAFASTSTSVTIANMASQTSLVCTSIGLRTINNTIVGYGNDTTEASVISSALITTSLQAAGGFSGATGLGYAAVLSTGPDSASSINNQVWVTLVSGTSASASNIKVTTTADVLAAAATASVACTYTSYTVGNIWYDIGSNAFFFTYSKAVNTYALGGAASCGSSSSGNTMAYTIYLGGLYVNGSAFWTTPLAITPTTATHGVSHLVGGGDNWLNSSNIYVAYKDMDISPATTYVSKTSKVSTVTTGGGPSTLVADSTTGTQNSASSTYMTYTYQPMSVWSSNFTYGITVSCRNGSQTQTQYTASPSTFTYTYSYTNYLNSTMTAADSGLSAPSGTMGASFFFGWQLTTGYTNVAVYTTSTSSVYVLGTFYGNGTVNSTATTLGSLQYGGISVYEDLNGTTWIGWQDVDTANYVAGNSGSDYFSYAGYLAKLQGQINVASAANILSVLSTLIPLFLAAIIIC